MKSRAIYQGRIKNWTKLSPGALCSKFSSAFPSEEEAVVAAIFACNRLIKKSRSRSTKADFYSIKGLFLKNIGSREDIFVAGYKVRDEYTFCRRCDGTGKYIYPEDEFEEEEQMGICPDCNGTGRYHTGTLYLWKLNIQGQPYSFHSYIEPEKLEKEKGEDQEVFGDQFTEEEKQVLQLPMSGLFKILKYYATIKWNWWWYELILKNIWELRNAK